MSEDAAMPVDSIITLKMERARLMQQAADIPVSILDTATDAPTCRMIERKRDLLHQATHLYLEIRRLEKLSNG